MAVRRNRSAQALLLVDFINLFDFDGAEKLGPRAIKAAKAAARLKAALTARGVP